MTNTPHADNQPDSAKAIIYALAANAAIAFAKFAGAMFTGSGSMLAEAFHSVADTGNQGLLLWGRRQSRKPPTPVHPLGQGRATFFWSFVVALLLFNMGGVASIYEGVHKLSDHAGIASPMVAIGILVFGLVVEGASLFFVIRQINKVRGDLSLLRWFRESRRSELIIVFGEDAAALAGLGLALAAVVTTVLTGNPVYDAAGSIAIGALLVGVALTIGVEIKSLLIGESAAPAVQRGISAFLKARPEIDNLAELITLQHGEDVVVAVKAQMAEVTSAQALVSAMRDCQAGLKEKFPQVRWVFFEPLLGGHAHYPPET